MRPRPALIGLLLALGVTTGACAAAKPGPAMHCRHPLATIGSADGLPTSIAADLKTWMALHGEHWNRTDALSPGELTAGFLWAGRSNADWIVAFTSGGIACCSNRFVLYKPSAGGASTYRMFLPPHGAPDDFGDATCKGVDAALSAYGTRG